MSVTVVPPPLTERLCPANSPYPVRFEHDIPHRLCNRCRAYCAAQWAGQMLSVMRFAELREAVHHKLDFIA